MVTFFSFISLIHRSLPFDAAVVSVIQGSLEDTVQKIVDTASFFMQKSSFNIQNGSTRDIFSPIMPSEVLQELQTKYKFFYIPFWIVLMCFSTLDYRFRFYAHSGGAAVFKALTDDLPPLLTNRFSLYTFGGAAHFPAAHKFEHLCILEHDGDPIPFLSFLKPVDQPLHQSIKHSHSLRELDPHSFPTHLQCTECRRYFVTVTDVQ